MIIKDYQENYGSGWVRIYRSILNNKIWTSQKFTRGQAWVDLLLLAKWKPGFFWVRDVKINYERGQVTEGIINLSLRWKWSRGKTQNFINILENEQQIEQQKLSIITLITITNYEQYQQNGQQDGQYTGQYTGQQDDNRQDTHNKDKKVNKDNNIKYGANNLDNPKTVEKEYFLNLLPIDSGQGFIEAWTEWVDFRKEIRKKLTESTAKKQIDFLLKQPNPIDCINKSIKNGWQGLFEDEHKKDTPKATLRADAKCVYCGEKTSTIIDRKPVCNFDHLTKYNNLNGKS